MTTFMRSLKMYIAHLHSVFNSFNPSLDPLPSCEKSPFI